MHKELHYEYYCNLYLHYSSPAMYWKYAPSTSTFVNIFTLILVEYFHIYVVGYLPYKTINHVGQEGIYDSNDWFVWATLSLIFRDLVHRPKS